MEKFLNMPVLLGHLDYIDIQMIMIEAINGCEDSKKIFGKYHAELQFFYDENGYHYVERVVT